MKRKFFMFLYFFVTVTVYSLDMSFEYYLPSVLGMASGETKMFSSFENNEIGSRFIIPLENKICVLNYKDEFSISVNSILSLYIEDNSFNSINYSAGISLFGNQFQTLSMTGIYFSFYPVCELPIIYDTGKKRFFDWKMATDLGYSITLEKLLQINLYTRLYYIWLDSKYEYLIDAGISLGFRL
jgi:hypothetical protein